MADPVGEANKTVGKLNEIGQASDIITDAVTDLGAKVSGNQQSKTFAGRI